MWRKKNLFVCSLRTLQPCSCAPTSWTRRTFLESQTPSWFSTGVMRMERELVDSCLWACASRNVTAVRRYFAVCVVWCLTLLGVVICAREKNKHKNTVERQWNLPSVGFLLLILMATKDLMGKVLSLPSIFKQKSYLEPLPACVGNQTFSSPFSSSN